MALLKVLDWSTRCPEKEFSVVIASMINTPKWTLRPWRVTIEAQLSSWGMYIPGVSTSSEMVEMKNFKGHNHLHTAKLHSSTCTNCDKSGPASHYLKHMLFAEMLDVMTVQEIDNPDSLTGPNKARICTASGKSPEDMSRMIFMWKQSLIMHTWLQEM